MAMTAASAVRMVGHSLLHYLLFKESMKTRYSIIGQPGFGGNKINKYNMLGASHDSSLYSSSMYCIQHITLIAISIVLF